VKKRLDNVSRHFSLVSKDEVEKLHGGHAIFFGSPNHISPYITYQFLRKYYGLPRRITTDIDDYDKVHWEYSLQSRHSILTVYDWKLFSWNIGVAYPYTVFTHNIGTQMCKKVDDKIRKCEKMAEPEARLLLSYITKYAKGRSSLVAKNIQILCARHNLQKRDRIA